MITSKKKKEANQKVILALEKIKEDNEIRENSLDQTIKRSLSK